MAIVINSRRYNVAGSRKEITFGVNFTAATDTSFNTGLSRVDFGIITPISTPGSVNSDGDVTLTRNSIVDTAEGGSPGFVTINAKAALAYTIRVVGT